MSIFSKLNPFDNIGSFISRKLAEEIAAKSTVSIRAALVELDKLAPVLTDAIAGRKIILHSRTEMWIEENPGDMRDGKETT